MATRNTGGNDSMQDNPMQGGPPVRETPSALSLKEQAADVGRKAAEGAKQMAAQAQSQARTRLERGKQDAAVTLTTVAATLLESGSQLRDLEQNMAGEYVERAARQIERAANFVQNADTREIVGEIENFARRRPAVFIGSAFAAGLLAARFLKSSRGTGPAGSQDFRQPYADREVPPNVAREMGTTPPPPDPWTEPGT